MVYTYRPNIDPPPEVEWGVEPYAVLETSTEELDRLRHENETLRERLQSTHALLGDVSGQVQTLQAENATLREEVEALKHDIERHYDIANREAVARDDLEQQLTEMRQVWDALHKELGEHPKGPVVALCEKLEAAEKREQEALAAVRDAVQVWPQMTRAAWIVWHDAHAAVIKRAEGE